MSNTDTKQSLAFRKHKDNGLLTDKEAIKLLKEAVKARKRAEHPNLPESLIMAHNYEDRTANGLTRCIIDFINSQGGCHAERISNEGVMRETPNGKAFRGFSSMQNGTADISATIRGRSVKIEVKIGTDRQSEAQKRYQRQIENAKGYYVIARDFKGFLQWFNAKYQGK